MRFISIKLFTAAVFLLAVYLFLSYVLFFSWFIHKPPHTMTSVVLPHVIVHIDLKVPPKLKYLESLLPMFKKNGVNGLLIEYEDMFPYGDKLVNISAKNCYGKAELTRFLDKASDKPYNFEIIPLIQTFGHLEHVLKLAEFRHLREDPIYPDSLCPSKIESRALIREMLDQVISFHIAIAPLKHIHVGCDEVFQINKCEQCVAKGISDKDIFVEHIKFLSEYMKEKIPTTTVLIWDDMLRSTKPNKWHFTSNNTNLEPVYWDYSPKLGISHLNLLNYRRNFRNIWIASAFKGADGKTATIPKIRDRFQNHFSWLKLILNYKFGGESKVYNFKGIILTGWSRYTHMDPPCELLPVAIPSLVLDLILVKKFIAGLELDATSIANAELDDFFNVHISNEYGKGLKCNTDFVIDLENILNCYFESRELYSLLHRYEQLKAGISLVFNTDEIPLFSCEYYASKKFIEKTHLIENINWCENAMKELITIEVALRENMKMYYKKRVIDEYLIYKTYSLKKNLEVILKALNSYKNSFVWTRNPLLGNVSD